MREKIILTVLGMAVVTFVPRFLPMAVLSRRTLPEKVRQGMEYIPVAVLSAIVFPLLFFDRNGGVEMQPRFLLAALAVFVFSWKVRSIWGSVVLGMGIYWLLGTLNIA